eukprot:6095053-Pleurochrysis_carterae.AAC.2
MDKPQSRAFVAKQLENPISRSRFRCAIVTSLATLLGTFLAKRAKRPLAPGQIVSANVAAEAGHTGTATVPSVTNLKPREDKPRKPAHRSPALAPLPMRMHLDTNIGNVALVDTPSRALSNQQRPTFNPCQASGVRQARARTGGVHARACWPLSSI